MSYIGQGQSSINRLAILFQDNVYVLQ